MPSLYLHAGGFVVLCFISPIYGRRVISKGVELQNQSVSTSGNLSKPCAKDWLELTIAAHQNDRTLACWALSAVEGLREQGYVAKLFKSGVIRATSDCCGDECIKVQWQTPKGVGWEGNKRMTSGEFKVYSWYYASWQQIVEEMWAQNRWGVDGSQFQKKMPAAPKGSGEARAGQLQKFLQVFDKGITVEGEFLGIHRSSSIDKLKALFTPSQTGPGIATVWQIDKNGRHAISVQQVRKYKSYIELDVYNQQGGGTGTFTIEAGKPKEDGCYSGGGSWCDGVWKFTIKGLPK